MSMDISDNTLILLEGTLACSCGLQLVRRISLEKAALQKVIDNSAPDDKIVRQQRLRDVDERVVVRAFDVDETMAYALPAPPDGAVEKWPVEMFVPLRMPGPDVVQAIREGRLKDRDFDFLNPSAYQALDGAGDASGGARPNGAFAYTANRERVEMEIRTPLQSFATRRRQMAEDRAGKVRVLQLTGLVGGTGTGSRPFSFERVNDVAVELGLDIDVQPHLLLPGTWPSKDPGNSRSLAAACLNEHQAAISGFLWRRRRRAASNKRNTARESVPSAYLIEDANNALGTSRSLPPERFASWMADLLWHLLFTPLGAHIRAKAGDFGVAAEKLTPAGEQRAGRTFGLATIHLDRHRQDRYSRALLEEAVLTRWLQPVDHEFIQNDVRACFESWRVVQGTGRSDLAQRLWEGDGEDAVDLLGRTMAQVRRTLDNFSGVELLESAVQRVADAIRTSGDRDVEIVERSRQLQTAVLGDADRRSADMRVSPLRGLDAAAHWLATAIAVLDNMEQAAGRDTPQYDTRLSELRAQLPEFDNYTAAVREKGRLYRWYFKGDIQATAIRCRSLHEQITLVDFQRAAHLCAIQTLRELRDSLQQRLSEVENHRQWAGECLSAAQERRKRAAAEDPSFGCPQGLPLLSDEDDLQNLNAQLVPDQDEAVRQFFARVASPGEQEEPNGDRAQALAHRLETIFENQETLAEAVGVFAEKTLSAQIEGLHVVDELRRRYGGDPERLKAILRERDLEGYERLRVKGSAELEHKPILVRLLGLDRGRAQFIEDAVPGAVTARGVPYAPVDTGDRDRIAFLQVYAGFPISDWEGTAQGRAAYAESAESATFERYHTWPFHRFLPQPGRSLTFDEVGVLAFEAWVLDRLEWEAQRGWKLLPGVNTEPEMNLGPEFESLYGVEGYRRGVDIASQFWCLYQEHGPNPIRERLAVLAKINGGEAPQNEVEKRLAAFSAGTAMERIEEQLEWVRMNTVPSAQEYYEAPRPAAKAHSGNGRP